MGVERALNGMGPWAAGCLVLALVMALASCSGDTSTAPEEGTPAVEPPGAVSQPPEATGGKVMDMTLTCSAFEPGGMIPEKYTGDGPDVSPPLAWTEPPEGTRSFALICDDPDAPMGTWVHWVVYGIPPETRALAEGVPKTETPASGAKQGITDFRSVGYGGPAPPPGKPHRYFFKLYALDTELTLGPRMTKKDVERAMEGHILARAELMGTYQR